MAIDLKPNQEKTNFISAIYKLTILTENNVHILIKTNIWKRLFPTFVQTLVWNMTFFFTVQTAEPDQSIHQIAADPNCQKSFNFGTENSHNDLKIWSIFVTIIFDEAQAFLSQAFQVNFWSIVPFEQNQKSFYY